ncbi:MAG TPA: hypothetical protein DCZ63_03305 [Geobacter sp.]|nr:hypothetical protein [Geobacter sp.]
MLAAAAHDFELLALGLGQVLLALQDLGITEDRVQRRAQFVAHTGQKLAFGAVGGFGSHLGGLQLHYSLGKCPGQFIYPLHQIVPLPLEPSRIAAAVQTPFLHRDDQPVRLLQHHADGVTHRRE